MYCNRRQLRADASSITIQLEQFLKQEAIAVTKLLMTCLLSFASLAAQVSSASGVLEGAGDGQRPIPAGGSVNPVVQWNRNLLAIVRSPGAPHLSA